MRNNNLIFITITLFLSIEVGFTQPSKLKTYGYFDLELKVSNKNTAGKIWTFDQHHLNVITIYHLDDRFRMFTEMEWEHGVTLEVGGEGYGKIYLTRAWLEYKHSDAFKVQTGKILVPFGIYGIKYDATPTFLSTFLPSSLYGKHENSVGKQDLLYPKWLTGLQVLGSVYTKIWGVDYYLYLTNGRGPDPSEKDNNANKGIGGRIIVTPPIDALRFGFSFYDERDGNSYDTRQTVLGLDLSLDYANLLVESELIFPRGERVDIDFTPNGRFRDKAGYYVQGAYTFYDRLTPFARYDFFDPNVDEVDDGETDIVAGINYSVTSRVYLKSEIHLISFQGSAKNNYKMVVAAIVVAF